MDLRILSHPLLLSTLSMNIPKDENFNINGNFEGQKYEDFDENFDFDKT